jgi:hypothetical protein
MGRFFQNIKLDLRDLLVIALILACSLGGMWMLRESTPFGLGINTDSVYYVNGARNLLSGNGFYRDSGEEILKPITHFPPLFSILLAGVGLTGLDPLRGGRLVTILLYGGNILLFACLAWQLTRSRWLALAGAALMTFSSVNLQVYSWLMSEPLYICLLLLAFLCSGWYFKKGQYPAVCLLGLLVGLMYLTRYIGLSMLLTGLVLVWLIGGNRRKKLVHSGLFLLASLPLMILVMTRNYRLTGSTGNRNFIIHWAPFHKISDGIQAFWSWFLPGYDRSSSAALEWLLTGLFFGLLLAGLVVLIWKLLICFHRQACSPFEGLLFALGLHCYIYLGLVFATMNFFDATTVFDDRMLLPVYDIILLLILAFAGWGWNSGSRLQRILAAVAVLVGLGLAVPGAVTSVGELHQDGRGFIDKLRRESPTMQYIREHDISLFYTNQPPTVYILTGKAGYMVPSPIDSLTLQPRPSYRQDLAMMKGKIRQQDGLLIFFYEPGYETDSWYLDLTAGLEGIENLTDAIIWGRVE